MQFSALIRLSHCAQCLKFVFPEICPTVIATKHAVSAQTRSFHCAFVSSITTHRDTFPSHSFVKWLNACIYLLSYWGREMTAISILWSSLANFYISNEGVVALKRSTSGRNKMVAFMVMRRWLPNRVTLLYVDTCSQR